MRVGAAMLGAGLAATALAAQTQPQGQGQPPVFRAGVDVVQLEVSVLDKDRRPVRGLASSEFAVFEDGDPQVVVDVQEFVLEANVSDPVWAKAASSDIATNSLSDRRLIAIVMDDRRCCWEATPLASGERLSDQWAIRNAIDTARHLVRSLGPNDLATVALTRDAMPALPFTGNRDDLYAAIARFSPMSEGGCFPQTPDTVRADLLRLLQMSEVPRKALVYLMSPVPSGRSTRPEDKVRQKPIPCPRPTYRIPGTGQVVNSPLTREVLPEPHPWDLARVPVYTLNVSGLLVDMKRVEEKQLPMSLSLMNGPNETGGWNYFRTNDLAPAVSEILLESDSYYLVGFRTMRPTQDGKYRRVEIKVTRPGDGSYEVRTRAGYRRPRSAPKPGSREARNPDIPRPPASVSGLLPKTAITLEASAGAFPLDAERAAVLVNVDVTHSIDTVLTQPHALELRTVAYRSGSAVREVRAPVPMDPASGISRTRASVPVRLHLEPDQYELWISARDPRTLRMGDVKLRVDVPDFAARPVVVSGIVLGSGADVGTPLPEALAGLVPLRPTTGRVFGTASELAAFFHVHQGGKLPLGVVSLRLRILDEQGRTRFDHAETLEPARFSSARTAAYSFRLPLETLSLGRHLLSVEARLGERIAPARDVPFEVR